MQHKWKRYPWQSQLLVKHLKYSEIHGSKTRYRILHFCCGIRFSLQWLTPVSPFLSVRQGLSQAGNYSSFIWECALMLGKHVHQTRQNAARVQRWKCSATTSIEHPRVFLKRQSARLQLSGVTRALSWTTVGPHWTCWSLRESSERKVFGQMWKEEAIYGML